MNTACRRGVVARVGCAGERERAPAGPGRLGLFLPAKAPDRHGQLFLSDWQERAVVGQALSALAPAVADTVCQDLGDPLATAQHEGSAAIDPLHADHWVDAEQIDGAPTEPGRFFG